MRLAQATRRSRLFGEPLIPYDGRMEEHIVSAARSNAGAHIPIRRPSCLVPDPAVVVGRAPGGARGSRHRLGAIDIQQRMPNLSYDQGRRQSPGPEPAKYHREESRLPAELRLFQCYEGRGFRVEQGEARRLHRETR